MKILYSNVIIQNLGWGAEYFVNRSFQKLGYETFCIDYRFYRHNLIHQYLDLPDFDVFFLQRGDNFPIYILKSINIPRFFWASELVARCKDQDRLFKSGLFNHIFVRTGLCKKKIIDNGWTDPSSLSILYSGFDESVFKPNFGIIKDIDILFVGTITPRRKMFLDHIAKYYKVFVTSEFGEKLVSLINRSKIILNIHADHFLDIETRVFEVLGCGGFLLSEQLSPENPFDNNDLIQFSTEEECIEKIEHYLKNNDARSLISQNGYKKALSEHTYLHRAQEIIQVMEKHIAQNNPPNTTLNNEYLKRYIPLEFVSGSLIFPLSSLKNRLLYKIKSVINKRNLS